MRVACRALLCWLLPTAEELSEQKERRPVGSVVGAAVCDNCRREICLIVAVTQLNR